ncbi:hypothetical protein ABIA32_001080 [Streptacidiphilus sp. MAP12-20]|uniref:hypothetical protein n=1 Tax=Streptacidiphilus sp. MAP12-20 TaxID=3156299 RepID=UPI003512FCDA
MGIESEQLVYDYLSRVGDLAGASPALTAADRARLVNTLRQTIDAQQAATAPRTARAEVGSVRKILAGLGTPDEVVSRAAGGALPASAAEVVRRAPAAPSVSAQASAPVIEGRADFVRADAGNEGNTGYATDWWTLGGGAAEGSGGYEGGIPVVRPPGWAGGFVDELDPSSAYRAGLVDPVTGIPTARQPEPAASTPAAAPKRGLLRRVLTPPTASAPSPAPEVAQPVTVPRLPIPFVEALATLVLVAAAVTGLWYVALLGWLFAYGGRRLGRGVGRFAALWVPGLTATACGFWLYSRAGHAPGHPGLTSAQMTAATHNAFAFWLRFSSGFSAAFLAWRISRR